MTRLPLSLHGLPGPSTPRSRELPEAAPASARLRVYLVEGNAHVRDNLAAALEEMVPLRVVGKASDARGARTWLASAAADCDLVIVDLCLGRGSGLGVLEAARRARPAAAVVVISNEASPRLRAVGLAAGAERVFDTSCDIDLLVDYCRNFSNERGGRRAPARSERAAPRAVGRGMSLAADPR